MANRDTGSNYGNTGGNRENQGNRGPDNPRGQTPGQDRGKNVPGQPGQGQGQPGDVRNESEWEREQRIRNQNQNPNDPNRPTSGQGGRLSDSDEEV